ncbi:hypothetical protein VIGAN_08081000 [Vigna angularis var. angularis]|uniref:Uncharacterized protein n=1 Tax=Vigna angularis var. angularis TaxID=157739 RepID=A0A0S3SN58_PHAAN|nr:hypothetical protein VIGAN_08081000 [Vigna angularis var. angularis]
MQQFSAYWKLNKVGLYRVVYCPSPRKAPPYLTSRLNSISDFYPILIKIIISQALMDEAPRRGPNEKHKFHY